MNKSCFIIEGVKHEAMQVAHDNRLRCVEFCPRQFEYVSLYAPNIIPEARYLYFFIDEDGLHHPLAVGDWIFCKENGDYGYFTEEYIKDYLPLKLYNDEDKTIMAAIYRGLINEIRRSDLTLKEAFDLFKESLK